MINLNRRTALASGLTLSAALLAGPTAAASPSKSRSGSTQEDLLRRWAADTWRSLDAMTAPVTGLPADNVDAALTTRSGYTSPTNIAGLLWSTLVARELGIITPGHARQRIARTLATLERMERHQASGMFYNWYSEADGSVLRTWPSNGNTVVPFVSSVDSGWLGAALYVVAQADPSNRRAARRLFDSMRWDVFFDRSYARQPGANVGGFWVEDPGSQGTLMDTFNGVGGPQVWYHITHHYDTAVSEARMVTYLGLLTGQVPAGAYFTTYRTFPVDWTWPEMPVTGPTRTYEGVEVLEGAHEYRGMRIVPGWGGSMFEELMPDLFVPEASWAPRSWGLNHPLHVRAQREHGLEDAGYGYWGFSPCSDPYGGYREYGVDALGLSPDGYCSDEEKTDYHHDDPPSSYGDGIVTPHASFLAMQYERDAAIDNLNRIETDLGAYGSGGFYDAAATRSSRIARIYLSLDQAMVMGALGNVLLDGSLHAWFGTSEAATAIRPVIAQEQFSARG